MSSLQEKDIEISKLKSEIVKLKSELETYSNLVDNSLNEILSNDEKQENHEKLNTKIEIDLPLIETKMKEKDDKYILNCIYDSKIDVKCGEKSGQKSLLILAVIHERFDIMKTCINLGADIDYKTDDDITPLSAARLNKNNEIIEYLLLQKMGGGKASEIVQDCAFMQKEDAILSSFLNEINKNDNEFKNKLVSIIISTINKQNPINSFLVNLCMILDSVKTWENINNIINKTIKNTNDKLSWFYINNYLLNNNTFLFRKYNLKNENIENKQSETQNEYVMKQFKDMTTNELCNFVSQILIPNFQKYAKEEGLWRLTETEIKGLLGYIKSEGMKGETFEEFGCDIGKLKQFFNSAGISADKYKLVDMIIHIQKTKYFMDENRNKVNKKYKLMQIIQDEHGFDKIVTNAKNESKIQSKNTLQKYFENEEKENKNNWDYIKNYGINKNATNIIRIRQDSLKYGVISQYSRNNLIKKVTPSFNALQFYNLNIYLNNLLQIFFSLSRKLV